MKELLDVSTFTQDRDWPKFPFSLAQRKRRRLTEGSDRWKAEEEQMKTEFLQHKSISLKSSSLSRSVDHNDNLSSANSAVKREMQLPLISKTCVNPQDTVVPCPPEDLAKKCDKYNGGDFKSCFQTCKVSVCCTHDSKRKDTPSCAETAVNCEFWIPCYIAWWKMADTIGPASKLCQSSLYIVNIAILFVLVQYS